MAELELEAPAAARPRGWGFWGFIGFMLALMALCIGLGIWQLERLQWKEGLIAEVADRMGRTPISLPPVAEWGAFDPDAMNYRPFTVTGTWLPDQTILVFTGLSEPKGGSYEGIGYWVMTPLKLEGGGTIFVDRGFVPQASGTAFATGGPLPTGTVTVTGIGRQAEEGSPFTPGPDAKTRIAYLRDPAQLAILDDKSLAPIAPIYLDLPKGPPGALPQGGETVIDFPNNHFGYALTWFGFAIIVPPLLWLWIRRQRRPCPKNLRS